MRKNKPHSYEIYASAPALNAPVHIVEDRFSVFAFLFHGIWLVYRGAWRVALIWFAVYGGMAVLGVTAGLSTDIITVLQIGMQFWLGLEAPTLLALDARMRGLSLQSVIIATNADEAEISYYRNHAAAA